MGYLLKPICRRHVHTPAADFSRTSKHSPTLNLRNPSRFSRQDRGALHYRTQANRRLAKHLRHEQPWLFTFLHCFGIDATNNAGEREIRPAVVARKTWGGNRTQAGADAQKILMSVLRTCYRQGKDSFERIVDLLRSPVPIVLDLVPGGASP